MKAKRTVNIETIDLSSNISVLNMSSLEKLMELQKPNELLLETGNDFFLLRDAVAFRVPKPEAKPKIFHAQNLEINPDHCAVKVELSSEELLSFSIRERIPIFETDEEYIIPAEICLTAKKGDLKK